MKNINKRLRTTFTYVALFGIMLLVTQCIKIEQVIQPEAVKAKERFASILQIRIAPFEPSTDAMIVGLLLPKNWNADKTTKISYKSDLGNGSMELLPGKQKPNWSELTWAGIAQEKAGFGNNKASNMEWHFFRTDKTYKVEKDISVIISIEMKAGSTKEKLEIGYFACFEGNSITDEGDFTKVFKPITIQ